VIIFQNLEEQQDVLVELEFMERIPIMNAFGIQNQNLFPFFNLNFLVFHWMDLVCQLAFLFDWFDYFFGWVCSFFVLYFQIDKIIQKTKEIQSFHVFCSHYGKIKFLFWKVIFESLFLFMGEVWMKKIN
jgi:hypothetical protein